MPFNWTNLQSEVLVPLATPVIQSTVSGSKSHSDYLELATSFSAWAKWNPWTVRGAVEGPVSRFGVPYSAGPGVYVVGVFGTDSVPSGPADPLDPHVKYVGESSRRWLKVRWAELGAGLYDLQKKGSQRTHSAAPKLWCDANVVPPAHIHVAALTISERRRDGPDRPTVDYHLMVERLLILALNTNAPGQIVNIE